MALLANRRSVMTLFSDPRCLYSHRVRIVLAEKGIHYEIQDVSPGNMPEDLIELNTYGEVPTLIDRDLVLYNSQVIMEYLDERFPHPPLMPVDPVSRARTRLLLHRIERDWYSLADAILNKGEKSAAKARKDMRDSLVMVGPLFAQMPFFMSEEFSLVDCSLAPLLWRLGEFRVDLPKEAGPVQDYCNRVFERPGFKNSLSSTERNLRQSSERG